MCMVVFVYFGNDCAKYVVFGVTINEVKKYACKFLNVCCYDLYTQEDINVSNWAYAYMYKGCYFKYKPCAVLCIIMMTQSNKLSRKLFRLLLLKDVK